VLVDNMHTVASNCVSFFALCSKIDMDQSMLMEWSGEEEEEREYIDIERSKERIE
jgi:hypothetical protein